MDTFTSSEFLKACDDFLASFEHDDKGALPAGPMEQLILHDSLRWGTNGSNSAKFQRSNGRLPLLNSRGPQAIDQRPARFRFNLPIVLP
jgi:hypothetical protein